MASSTAWGLGLGRLSVQSALGETLKAEIDITSLSPEESGTLKVRIAPPESYRATGVEYNSVLSSTQVQVARSNGRTFLRVSSDRAVQEPFVDVILELTWASGRLVREYTLLFDPPASPKPATAPPAVVASPVISAAAPEPVNPPAPSQSQAIPPVAAPTPVPAPAAPAVAAAASRPAVEAPRPRAEPAAARAPAAAPAAAAAASSAASGAAGSEYKVKPGDFLSRIASKTQVPGVSLDQMLVGLYRNNPDAFLGGNMNRLKSGSVLQVPVAETLTALPPAEAREIIRAQSADFSAYRLRLSSAAPTLEKDQSDRQAKGKVEAAVEDRKPAPAPTPDKLMLSKAASANAAAVDAKAAKASKETEKKDAAARMAELTRNVEELKKISSAAKPAASAPTASPAAPAPASASVLPTAPVIAAAPLVAEPASKPASVASAAAAPAKAVASASAASAAKPASAPMMLPAPVQEAEPGLLDQFLSNPLALLGGALALVAGGFGLYRLRARQGGAKADTGFHESRLQPDSFFGATGGQRVDTRDASGAASSMNYSLSQLDAIGDVDPVAEADVYLAYGRDLQAEEILKEALRATPERLAIRLKLLEVYAKRRDSKGFEQLAVQLFAETDGRGDDWARAQELGRQIDPENPLYQPGGAPSQVAGGREQPHEPMDASTMPHTAGHLATEPLGRSSGAADTSPMSGFDLDLDLDLATPAAPAPAPASPTAMEATQAMATTVEQAPLAMDFDLSDPAQAAPAQATMPVPDLEFDLDDLDKSEDVRSPPPADTGAALDFDLSAIDLDLPALPETPAPIPAAEAQSLDDLDLPPEFAAMLNEGNSPAEAAPAEVAAPSPLENAFDLMEDEGDPLQRQLELADEFRQIGDTEGAREVLQELISKAGGPLRDKAQAMLNELR
ncbi:FimV/HubP family polar landmark protein [Roseateles sp.]|uniref:FimV/HubP family polar landmark protein n=1 Tax=Roseateles sp. TaxID=1971397 RepID=UPI003BA4FEA7